MNTQRITQVAHQAIAAFDSTAHSAINVCHQGGERLGHLCATRWDTAFTRARPQLSAETRRNAARARAAMARAWRTGLNASTTGADMVVSTLVQAASAGVDRADALAQSRQRA